MISSFSEKNIQLIETMFLGNASYKSIHEQVTELFKQHKKISRHFEQYHSRSKNTEIDHILPYAAHLSYNVNLLRSGKLYLTEYIKRQSIV